MKWTDRLQMENPDVYRRLCACCNRQEDIPFLTDSRWRYLKAQGKDKEGYTKEDALGEILDWLDCNGQWFDLTRDEYDGIIQEA